MTRRPFVGSIKPYTWRGDGPELPGLLISGRLGVAAHVTKAEAFELANRLVDAAELLPEPTEPRHTPCNTGRGDIR